MPKIFISYSHNDSEFVRRLSLDLEIYGIDLWIDTAEILVGDSLIAKLRAGIDNVDYFGVVISKSSISSPCVQHEIDVAMTQEIAGKRLKVLPILLERCELPGFLAGKLYADFSDPDNYDGGLDALLKRLDSDNDPFSSPLILKSWPPSMSLSSMYIMSSMDARNIATEQRHLIIASFYNKMGMEIMKLTGEPSGLNQIRYFILPDRYRRAYDSAVYAQDSGNYELHVEAERMLEELEQARTKTNYLNSSEEIVMREAVRLFRMATRLGDPEGAWNLAWRYELGQGVLKSHERAVRLWREAAKVNHKASMDKLADLGFTDG